MPKPQLGEQLSSGGDAGKLAFSKPGKFGVFEATLPDGQKVAVKIYPDQGGSGDADQRARFARDMAALEAASRTSLGPGFFGEVNVGPRRRGFAMERIEGDFAEAQPRTDRELTDSERIAERLAQARITDGTLEDVKQFGEELLGQGYYYDGEIQGLIDFKGRYRPIDFEKVRPLSRDPQDTSGANEEPSGEISNEIEDLQSLRRPPEDRLPADLPVPAHLQGLGQQVFGTDVIEWGSGMQGTSDRLASDPRQSAGRTGTIAGQRSDPGYGEGLACSLSASERSKAQRHLCGSNGVAGGDSQADEAMRLVVRSLDGDRDVADGVGVVEFGELSGFVGLTRPSDGFGWRSRLGSFGCAAT